MKEMQTIASCRSCGAGCLVAFFDLGKQPLANSLLKKRDAREKAYPLSLSFCRACSLVQLNETIDPRLMFLDYPWVTGTSGAAREFAEVFAKNVLRRSGTKDPFVLEVASNDGTFLLPFVKKGLKALGVDPARNIAPIAKKSGVRTVVDFFGEKAAKKIVREHGTADIVIARNVLYHLADLGGAMRGIERALAASGILAAEFHYGGKMLRELHYDTIYHEHVCYYTLKSFEKLLNRYGMYGFDIARSPINSGGLIVYASKEKRNKSQAYKRLAERESKLRVNTLASWKAFAKKATAHRDHLKNMLLSLRREGKCAIGYGASARSSTLLNYCGISGNDIAVIADANQLKHGLYTAGSHIPITDPQRAFLEKPDVVFLLAWNFAKEIVEIARSRYGFKGEFLVPLPQRPRII
ncbi:MAG: class I SAM-dependent methyltransferase [Candidatus Vogelbacteria bacterium]|nr:class I SAM-dependent methyltransferase [Candidatus Vogelbacteria bacterium]